MLLIQEEDSIHTLQHKKGTVTVPLCARSERQFQITSVQEPS